MEKENLERKLSVEISNEVSDGIYSNLAIISHSQTEFIADFATVMPNAPKAKVRARIILTPEHARRLLNALQDNINRYEKQFGEIDRSGNGSPNIPYPLNFGNGGEA